MINRAKVFMRSITKMEAVIENKQGQLEEIRTRVEKITSELSADRVQTSSTNSREEFITRLIDLEQEIKRDIQKYIDTKRKVMRLLEQIEDGELIEILDRRYLKKQDWSTIAVELHRSLRMTYNKHGEALQELNKLLEKDCS